MSRLTLFLLGPPQVECDDVPMKKVDTRKAIALLAYLAFTHKSHSRDSIINLLWPEFDESRARTALRHTLYVLNQSLEGDWLEVDRKSIGLNPDADIWLDVDEFHGYLSECGSHGHEVGETCPNCVKPLSDAVESYRGDFLSGFSLKDSVNFDDWQFSLTQSLKSEMTSGLERLVGYLSEEGEYEKAIGYSKRWLELDRAEEKAHRHLMELYARTGQRTAALRQYEDCVRILEKELSETPQEETVRLFEAIKDNTYFNKRKVEETEVSPTFKPPDTPSHNLPRQLTSFIGRENEIGEIKRLLSATPLLTLTGSGGCGKTRLGLEVVAGLIDDFKDGVFFVSLAPISDPDLVAFTIAHTLGLQESGGQPILESLKNYLRDKEILLLLDNFEQIVSTAPLISDLLATYPKLKVLVTSRELLHLRGEQEYQVPPLSLPDPEKLAAGEADFVSALTQYEAVRLFIQRALDVKADFEITNENATVIAEICHRLDGLPLALELAAARIKLLTAQAILERLSSRMKLLTGGARDLPERQQTIGNTIAWSHDLLEESEKILFRRLSVFVGVCTLEAAEKVCNAESDPSAGSGQVLGIDVLDGVASLVDKSLLKQAEVVSPSGKGGEPRFLMLETVREYALEQLTESGEEEGIRKGHADFFLSLGEEAETQLHGLAQLVWFDRLEDELGNLRAVLEWNKKTLNPEAALRLSGSLLYFWLYGGYLSEGREWLEGMLGTPSLREKSSVSTSVRIKALYVAGMLSVSQGDFNRGVELGEEGLALSRDQEDRQGMAWSFLALGLGSYFQGEFERAIKQLEEALSPFREVGDKLGIALSLRLLGLSVSKQGDYGRATTLFEESLAVSREIGDKQEIAYLLRNQGLVAIYQGDYERAEPLCKESLTLSQEMGDKWSMAWALEGLSSVAIFGKGQPERAARVFGAAQVLREDIGAPLPPSDRDLYDRSVAAARSELEEEAFAAAWAEGRAMSMEEAIEYALGTPGEDDNPL